MIFDQKRCNEVMDKIFGKNGSFLAQLVLALLNPQRSTKNSGGVLSKGYNAKGDTHYYIQVAENAE